MATDLQNRPDTDSNSDALNPGQNFYDREFGGNTSPENYGKTASPEDLRSAENAPQATDKLGAGYNPKNGGGTNRITNMLKRNAKKKAAVAAVGGAGSILLIVLSLMSFSFLKLDFILDNIDIKTFSRYNASFSRRSDSWLRSYIQIRMMEVEGTVNPGGDGNLYFRSNAIDNDNPIRDWYRTLRTGKFEREIFNQQGIHFTSLIGPDGKFKTAKIIFSNKDGVEFDPKRAGFTDADLFALSEGPGGADFDRIINQMTTSTDNFIQVEVFNSDRDARRALRQTVNDNTRFRQVIKRHALRKDIQNMTGIRSWRFFEKTRGKIEDKQVAVQKKILQKVFNADSNNQKFILCLFGAGPCPSTTDPNDPSNRTAGSFGDDQTPHDDEYVEDRHTVTNEDGTTSTVETRNRVDGGGPGRGSRGAIDEVAGSTGGSSPTQDIIKKMIGQMAGPVKLWPWLKKIATIDELFNNTSQDSKLVKLVKNARLAQAVAAYSTVAIARDQLHTGEANEPEVAALMQTVGNFDNSEAWDVIQERQTPGTVSAGSKADPGRERYCNPDYDRQKDDYQYFCDDLKPNSGGRAGSISTAYSKSIGIIIHPIANVVNGLKNSIFGDIIGAVNGVIDSLMAPIINLVLKATGGQFLVDKLASFLGVLFGKLLGFLGAGPMWEVGGPDMISVIMAGSAGLAETGARSSGGIASTKVSLEYSNKIAAEYQLEETSKQSFATRYISLDNSNSLVSKSILAMSSGPRSDWVRKFVGSFLNLPETFGSILSGHANAGKPSNSAAYAQFAGVDTYDIPENCIDLDPLDRDYVNKATNLEAVTGIEPTWELLNDTDKFWAAVYEEVGKDQARAESIYNCAALDKKVRVGLGATSGYSDSGGYTGETGAVAGGTVNTTGLLEDSTKIQCAVGTRDIGIQDGYSDKNLVKIRICAIPNLPSTSGESNNQYGVIGAQGQALVNSRISGVVFAMVNDAKADGVTLKATSSFRTMSHQQSLCPCDGRTVAVPGTSNHQMGLAIDFSSENGGFLSKDEASFKWLSANASQYGIKNYPLEPWHWSATGH